MARAARRHGKRGVKKGTKFSAKHKANISAGLRRAWRAGKFKNRKHGKRGHRRKRGSKRYYHNIAKRFDESVRRKRAGKRRSGKRKKRTVYLTKSRSGKSYFK